MSNRSKVLVHDGADIGQLIMRLVIPWTLPRIEVRNDAIPGRVLQLAQHRIERLSGACNCLLGEALAGTILMGGSFAVWVVTQSWRDLALVLIAAVYAGLIGKGINIAWTRVRLLRVLLHLRHQLGAGSDIDQLEACEHGKAQGGIYLGHTPPKPPANYRAAVDEPGVRDDQVYRPSSPDVPRRPKVLLQHSSDIDRLLLRLATRWKLPRVEISMAALPPLAAQRAQHHIRLLSESCNCVLAGFLAAATLLGGSFYVIWMPNQNWDWTTPTGWGFMGMVLIFAPCAALAGAVIEVAWNRLRMLRTLFQLRSQICALECRT
ncbi:MAG: hypothetical protein ABI645_04770 [Pseudomonadota bacterium]